MSYWRFVVAMTLLSVTFGASMWGELRITDQLSAPLATIPNVIDGWNNTSSARFSPHVENALAATEYLSRVYRQNDKDLDLLISYYSEQRAGETMHSPQACLPAAGWEPWDYSTIAIPVGNERIIVNRYAVQKDGQRMQVLYWYQSKHRIVANEYVGKAALVWDSILRRGTGGALVRIMISDQPSAVDLGTRFASNIIPEMRRLLGN